MALTSKDRRIVISFESLESKKRTSQKYRTRKKILKTIDDFEFLAENQEQVFKHFGIRIPGFSEQVETPKNTESENDEGLFV